jgi:small-conductance mechanosensitive channel/CRP-like cAMP-binding protein
MAHTPLQSALEIGNLGPQVTSIAEGIVALVALLFAIAIRRRSLLVNAGSLVLLAVSLALDVLAIHSGGSAKWLGAFAVIFFYWAMVRIVVDLIFRPRSGVHYSAIPHDAVMLLLWMLVLAIVFYADLNFDPMKLFASGALVSGGLVFALQEPLRNLATGVTFQITKPFRPGDWVHFQNHLGQVKGTTWVSTEIVTRAYERIQIPNNMLVSQPVKNFRNTAIADEIEIGISYEDSPGSVKEVILKVIRDVAHVASDPPPQIYAWEYGDYAIKYRIRYFLADYGVQESVRDAVVSSLWYALRRHAIDIPYPTQTLEMRRPKARQGADAEFEKEIISDLRRVDWLRELRDEELRVLLPTVQVHQFGVGEVLMREGDAGDSFYIIRRGELEVTAKSPSGEIRQVARLSAASPSPFTGEGAFLEGGVRNATVRARTDVEVLEMSRQGLAQLFKAHPELGDPIAETIATRERQRGALLAEEQRGDGVQGRRHRLLARMREIFDFPATRPKPR